MIMITYYAMICMESSRAWLWLLLLFLLWHAHSQVVQKGVGAVVQILQAMTEGLGVNEQKLMVVEFLPSRQVMTDQSRCYFEALRV